jgi:hypothetical protein
MVATENSSVSATATSVVVKIPVEPGAWSAWPVVTVSAAAAVVVDDPVSGVLAVVTEVAVVSFRRSGRGGSGQT